MYRINQDEIKILATDVDGTLFYKKYGPLPEKDKKVLDDFISHDNFFALNTGNIPFQMVSSYLEVVSEVSNSTRYMICSNGNIVKDLITNETFVKNTFTNKDVLELALLCDNNQWRYDVVGDNAEKWYFKRQEDIEFYVKYTKSDKNLLLPITEQNIYEINKSPKFTIRDLDIKNKEYIEKEILKINSNFHIIWWSNEAIDIVSQKVDKYDGILSLIEIINKNHNKNFTINNVVFFGDQLNDLAAFQKGKYSIAVENAVDELKELAYEITESVQNGGIWRYIEKIREIS